MSRTFSTITAVVASLLVGTTALYAQTSEQDASRAEMIRMLAGGAQTSAGTSASQLRQDLQNRIQAILGEIDNRPQIQGEDGPLTISDIDKLNRSAERERTELEFEKARYERMQLEVERLLTLYETVKTIEEDEKAIEEARRNQLIELIPTVSDEDEDTDLMAEQDLLPRIDSISGLGGVYSAEADFNGNATSTLRVGDEIQGGFVVEDISSTHVVLSGPLTGNKYRLLPTPPVAPQPQAPGIQSAIDLSQIPIASF